MENKPGIITEYREVLQTMRGESLLWGEAINVLEAPGRMDVFEDIYIEKPMRVLDAFLLFDGWCSWRRYVRSARTAGNA